jgi:alpha-beta hydrolase superfamily lysophospholipase
VEEQIGKTHAEATPLWFGPNDRPLFGWLHVPRGGTARAGVVLCQPLGIEATCVYFSYRLLADRLVDHGLAVLRFDYDGTGDSYGFETDPDRLESWLRSVKAATDLLTQKGLGAIGFVGIRIGALFAACEASRRGGVDALVLWDPSLSGKAFLREQRFLREMSRRDTSNHDVDAAVEAPGLRFEAETVETLSELALERLAGPLARRILVLMPPGQSRPPALEHRFDGLAVDWQTATGQDLLLDSRRQVPPIETIESVAIWLSDALPDAPTRVISDDQCRAEVGRTSGGKPVVETAVRFAPIRLFGITTEVEGVAHGPTIVLVNEGNTHHIGQARIWVDLARRLATAGLRVLRFDLSGNGDSGIRPGQKAHVVRAPEAVDDVMAASLAMSPDDPKDVVLVGFCSGAYEVMEQALRAPPRGVCLINPSFSFVPAEGTDSHPRPARQVTRRWFVTMVGPFVQRTVRGWRPGEMDRWDKALENGTWPVALATRHPAVPKPVWWFVHRLLLQNTGIATIEKIVGADVDTLLVSGPRDYMPISLGSEKRIRRLKQSVHFRVVLIDDLDHSSWVMDQRHRLIDVLADHLVAMYGPSPSVPSPSVQIGSTS